MTYSGGEFRTKKPFNPLLGETYEIIHEDVKYISEQVSHHPPISACYAESPKFIFYGDSNIKTSLKITGSMEIGPVTSYHIELKETGDHFVISKPKVVLRNIIAGKMYTWTTGELKAKNLKTGDEFTMNYQDEGWLTSNDHKVKGDICDKEGEIKYKLKGKWNKELFAYPCFESDVKEIKICERLEEIEKRDWQFMMNPISINMNHLPTNL